MSATREQQEIIDLAVSRTVDLIKVEACAGSGKTHTLREVAQQYRPETALYLAYNKAIATEAMEKFKGTNVKCQTIHSLAYRSTVSAYGLKVGFPRPSHVAHEGSMEFKGKVLEYVENYCLSGETDLATYLKAVDAHEGILDPATVVVNDMFSGKIPCTHAFYLKLYHILLDNRSIPAPRVNLLMVDEFGDITALTIEIFRLIQADLKLAVGDSMQNIYGFTQTINGFKALRDVGVSKKLTESFRVSAPIAERIEGFCNDHLDTEFKFKGRVYPQGSITETHGYISRTNAGMIEKMISLADRGIEFNLTRPAKAIFSLPLTLLNLKKDAQIFDPQYKYLEKDLKRFYKSDELQSVYLTPFKYIATLYADDIAIKAAVSLISKHSPSAVYAIYAKAKAYEETGLTYYATLSTGHSSKGLEFDEVTILDDFNLSISKTINKIRELQSEGTPEADALIEVEEENLRLYYVASSRAKLRLHNAVHLPE